MYYNGPSVVTLVGTSHELNFTSTTWYYYHVMLVWAKTTPTPVGTSGGWRSARRSSSAGTLGIPFNGWGMRETRIVLSDGNRGSSRVTLAWNRARVRNLVTREEVWGRLPAQVVKLSWYINVNFHPRLSQGTYFQSKLLWGSRSYGTSLTPIFQLCHNTTWRDEEEDEKPTG